MVRKLIWILVLTISIGKGVGQRSSITLELLGHGIVYSCNHEWITASKRTMSLGLYANPFEFGDTLEKGFGVPASYGWLVPMRNAMFDVGAGPSFIYGYRNTIDFDDDGNLRKVPLASLYLVGRVGWRKGWNNKFLRISINPIYHISDNLFNYNPKNSQVLIIGDNTWSWTIGIAFGIGYKK